MRNLKITRKINIEFEHKYSAVNTPQAAWCLVTNSIFNKIWWKITDRLPKSIL